MKRVIAYYDGSNFYHYAKATYGISTVDFNTLAKQILRDDETLAGVSYFTSPVNQQEDQEGYKKQQRFLSFVKNLPLTRIHFGKLVKRPLHRIHINCGICGHQEATELKCPKCKKTLALRDCYKLTEKGVDVRMAMAMLLDGLENKFDCLLLFSSDADFSPAVQYIIKRLKKDAIYCKFPGKATSELLQSCTESRTITKEMMDKSIPLFR
jgi:uncharacterized LabA/DUF88 family protein